MDYTWSLGFPKAWTISSSFSNEHGCRALPAPAFAGEVLLERIVSEPSRPDDRAWLLITVSLPTTASSHRLLRDPTFYAGQFTLFHSDVSAGSCVMPACA